MCHLEHDLVKPYKSETPILLECLISIETYMHV